MAGAISPQRHGGGVPPLHGARGRGAEADPAGRIEHGEAVLQKHAGTVRGPHFHANAVTQPALYVDHGDGVSGPVRGQRSVGPDGDDGGVARAPGDRAFAGRSVGPQDAHRHGKRVPPVENDGVGFDSDGNRHGSESVRQPDESAASMQAGRQRLEAAAGHVEQHDLHPAVHGPGVNDAGRVGGAGDRVGENLSGGNGNEVGFPRAAEPQAGLTVPDAEHGEPVGLAAPGDLDLTIERPCGPSLTERSEHEERVCFLLREGSQKVPTARRPAEHLHLPVGTEDDAGLAAVRPGDPDFVRVRGTLQPTPLPGDVFAVR